MYRYAVSWSGGKDSALALWRAAQTYGAATALLTMFIEDGSRSRSHGLRPEILAAQARALNIPLIQRSTSWREYETHFVSTLELLKTEYALDAIVFGDIDLEDHRIWCQRVCDRVGLACLHPLWGERRESLLEEFIAAGFEARLVAVQEDKLDSKLLGRFLDAALLNEFRQAGIDLCGENGEYHSVLTGGPIFPKSFALKAGESILRDGYWFLDFTL